MKKIKNCTEQNKVHMNNKNKKGAKMLTKKKKISLKNDVVSETRHALSRGEIGVIPLTQTHSAPTTF